MEKEVREKFVCDQIFPLEAAMELEMNRHLYCGKADLSALVDAASSLSAQIFLTDDDTVTAIAKAFMHLQSQD
jgi:hypothetical protein